MLFDNSIKLRDYQLQAIDATRQTIMKGISKPLIIAPTASGKSVIIAGMVDAVIKKSRDRRVLSLCFQNEILEQNESCLNRMSPDISTGIYCASSKRKDTNEQVIFASRDSLRRDPMACGEFDIVIVDEAHLVSNKEETSYGKIFKAIDPTWIIGLTGTPWRMDNGRIWGERGFFEEVSYNISLKLLIERGYLSKYNFPKPEEVIIDTTYVKVKSTGDFDENELTKVSSTEEVVSDCIDLWQENAKGKKTSLFFCCSLAHANVVNKELINRLGENNVAYLDGKTNKKERVNLIRQAKEGVYRAIVNVGVLTTGVDIPIIDCIVMLRATRSASLFVQSIGRGLRICEDKNDCLILDMTDNFERFDSLENPLINFHKRKNKKDDEDIVNEHEIEEACEPSELSEAPTKSCPFCKMRCWTNIKVCHFCGHIFISHGISAKTKRRMSGWFIIDHYHLEKTKTKKGDDCVIATYYLFDLKRPIKEWLMYEKDGFVGHMGRLRLEQLNKGKAVAIFTKDRSVDFPRIDTLKIDENKIPVKINYNTPVDKVVIN